MIGRVSKSAEAAYKFMSKNNNKNQLLTRDQFREGVFERDSHQCVICGEPAVDAHHILERRLWDDGGYYLDNGASLCKEHHLDCEMTVISVEQVREACGIEKPILPEALYRDYRYDKWGNLCLSDARRIKGELFHDESVQKILKAGGMLELFTKEVKYPRTFHLSWSPGQTDDDRQLKDNSQFEGKRVIATTKLDGESTTMYSHTIHARSIDSRNHHSRDYVKNQWASLAHNIPEGWRVCGENMYAVHSIKYTDLETYFYGFSIWDEVNECLDWDETVEYFELLGIEPVPVLYDGIFDEQEIRKLWTEEDRDHSEGYVVRNAAGFQYKDFRRNVAKFVRPGHVQTAPHWMHGRAIEKNLLKTRKDP